MKKLLSAAIVAILSLSVLAIAACDLPGMNKEGNESVEISMEQSKLKMETLGKTEGYELTISFTTSEGDSGNLTIGAKGEVIWGSDDEGNGFAVKQADSGIYTYVYENGEYTFNEKLSEEEEKQYIENYTKAYSEWLYYANEFNGMLKKGSDVTVAGRTCHSYTFNMGDLGVLGNIVKDLAPDVNVDYKVCVDVELGITMKLDVVAAAEGETNALSCEIISFKTGNAVTAPSLPEPTEDPAGEE